MIFLLKTRYVFLKKLYSNDVIIFKLKKKYYIDEEDLKIVFLLRKEKKKIQMLLEEYHINYQIIDNMKIEKRVAFNDNNYLKFYNKYLLYNIIKVLKGV